MSLVSHDFTWKSQYGVFYESKDDRTDKNNIGGRALEKDASNQTLGNDKDFKIINDSFNTVSLTEIHNDAYKDVNKDLREKHNYRDAETYDTDGNKIITFNNNISNSVQNSGRLEAEKTKFYKIYDSTKYRHIKTDTEPKRINNCENKVLDKVITEKTDKKDIKEQRNDKQMLNTKNGFQNLLFVLTSQSIKSSFQKRSWQRQNKNQFWMKNSASNSLKRLNEKCKRKSRWRFNSGVIISLMILNVAGFSNAVDSSSFTSSLTSRMIASFLGYPSTCSPGGEVRPCTLTLTCWLRGGTRLRGCGGWLFSCCGLPEPSRETFDNSIPSSEWKYKPPSKLRLVPQRSVLPNNVFRRRVDDDATQMDCGLPSSRILQKRIIGGREARFAEFPWQAHVRISEFQCGGVLVSHRYVATAAHCVSRAHTRDIAVWLGAIDTSATHHPARKLGVIQKILHPLFQFRMTQPDRYDIALLMLSRPITYMSHILPICLPDHDMNLRGRSGVIAGWGKTDATNGHTGTNMLRSATVPILSKEQCINWHQSKQISVEIHSEMICAGHSDGHQDACLGDSGGPLIVLDSGRYYLVGITSAGFGCGVDHQPGIYHNVKLTANWIRSIISPISVYNENYLD